MQRFIFLVAILMSLLLVSYLSYGRLSNNAEVTVAILTPDTVNRPPLGEVLYSPDERYAADIAVFHLYLRDTQTNTYIELDHQDIIPEAFDFNSDGSLLAAYGCITGTANSHGYCGGQRIVVWYLSNEGSELVAVIDDLPLARLSSIRFIISDSAEYITVSGCEQIDDSILGLCHQQKGANEYWSVTEQDWVVLTRE